jgi:Uma2 family endonuclease
LALARFSVEQYHRMIGSGAFTEEDPLELIDGWVVKKMPKGPEHELAVGETQDHLQHCLPPGWHVRNQSPITLATSEPEPDVTLARGRRNDFRDRHPGPDDIALLIEASDTTLAIDRLKGRVYGSAGIPFYWIINLSERCIEMYSHPTESDPRGYLSCDVYRAGDHVPVVIQGREVGSIPVDSVLP